MPFTCLACGGFRDELDACPHCGEPVPRSATPLLVVAGSGGTGKSTVCAALAGQIAGAVLMDTDPVGYGSIASRERDLTGYWGYLATIAYEVARNSVTPVWCGPMLADQLLDAPQSALFPAVHFLALTCERDVLAARIAGRPGDRIKQPERHLAVNDAWQTLTVPPPATITRFDVTRATQADTIATAESWIRRHQHLR